MNAIAQFHARTRGARRVLVIDPGMLGDAVHLVPALHDLRANYPVAELHVVSSPVGSEVLALAGSADRQWILEQAREKRTLRAQARVLVALRRLRFDVTIVFGENDRNILHAGLIGARERFGQRGRRWHFWSPWCIPNWAQVPDRAAPAFEQRRQLLAACGFTLGPPRFALRIPQAAAQHAESLVSPGAIHFSINASHALKEWPLEHWVQAAKMLLGGNPALRIFATGSPSEREQKRLKEFATGVRHSGLTVLEGGRSVAELGALLQRCRLHVGADSGVLHLAAALGTRVLALFREYADAKAWMPMSPPHRVLSAPCGCVNRRPPPCAAGGHAECLDGIAPEVVVKAIREMLEQVRED